MKKKSRISGKECGISVIIPTYYDNEDVESQVRNILEQDYDDYEIVVVNGNPRKKIRIRNQKVRVINDSENKGRSSARNIGERAAEKDILVFLDAKITIPSKDVLGKIHDYFGEDENRKNILKCRVLHDIRHYGDDMFISSGMRMVYAHHDTAFNGESNRRLDIFMSDFFAIKKEQYRKYPFCEKFGKLWGFEDTDFAAEQQLRGADIIYTNNIIGLHDKAGEESGFLSILTKYFQSGINYRKIVEKKDYMKKGIFRHCVRDVFRKKDALRRVIGNKRMLKRERNEIVRLLVAYREIEDQKKKFILTPKTISKKQEKIYDSIIFSAIYLGKISINDASHAKSEAENIIAESSTIKIEPSILLIVVYLGRNPEWLSSYLRSCELNPSIDWLIMTDWKTIPKTPSNVRIKKITKGYIEKLIEKKTGTSVMISDPRKLCDFKPLYGKLFEKYLKGHDFWGFTDLDVIYGNIRKFIKNDMLQCYDVITSCKYYCTGHFTIMRNNEMMKNIFSENRYWKKMIGNTLYTGFDEAGLTEIMNRRKIKWYHEDIHVGPEDNRWFSYGLISLIRKERADYKFSDFSAWNKSKGKELESCPFGPCLWNNGKLIHAETGREMMYLHFNSWRSVMSESSGNNKWSIGPDGIKEF